MCGRKSPVLSAAATCALCLLGRAPAADLPESSKQGTTVVPAANAIDPVLKRLSDAPVSVLDYGLEMMWRDLDDTAKDRLHHYGTDGAFPARVTITYDAKESKIWISIESNPGTEGGPLQSSQTKDKAPSAEEWCKTLVGKLRANLAGGRQPPRWLRYFVSGYGHSAFAEPEITNTEELRRLNATLPKRVFLRAHSAQIGDAVHCTGPLIGSEISIVREPSELIE